MTLKSPGSSGHSLKAFLSEVWYMLCITEIILVILAKIPAQIKSRNRKNCFILPSPERNRWKLKIQIRSCRMQFLIRSCRMQFLIRLYTLFTLIAGICVKNKKPDTPYIGNAFVSFSMREVNYDFLVYIFQGAVLCLLVHYHNRQMAKTVHT